MLGLVKANAYSDSIKYDQLNFFKKPSKKIIYLYLAGVSDLKNVSIK